jgi:hypothetical protein
MPRLYPIRLNLDYRVVSEGVTLATGTGSTVQLSSKSVVSEANNLVPLNVLMKKYHGL